MTGEEVTFSYLEELRDSREARNAVLMKRFHFDSVCRCPRCVFNGRDSPSMIDRRPAREPGGWVGRGGARHPAIACDLSDVSFLPSPHSHALRPFHASALLASGEGVVEVDRLAAKILQALKASTARMQTVRSEESTVLSCRVLFVDTRLTGGRQVHAH